MSDLANDPFMLTLFTRIVIMALAAVSLNLILGFGGMMSFGHAVYLGLGGYAVGILAYEHVYSGFVQWPVALGVSALFALLIGALSLRTRGVYFIMITLAFAQMAYYIISGIARYGGDDGLTIYKRSQFVAPIDLSNKTQFYYICLALLFGGIYLVWRLVNSRFGMVIQGSRSNDVRMRAIGFPTFRYKLIAFVIAGTMCGLAGALLANHTDFISPSMMYWTHSGDLMIMVVLGGMGSVIRPGIRRCGLPGARGGAALPHQGSVSAVRRRAGGAFLGILANRARAAVAAGGAVRARRHRRAAQQPRPRRQKGALMSEPLLQVERLAKRFGGIVATDDLSLTSRAGELHAVIGPNGAGKTTLIAQLSGQLTPDSGAHPLRRRAISPRCRCTGAACLALRARSRSPRCFSISACSTMSRSPCRRMPDTRSTSGATRAASPNCASRRAPRSLVSDLRDRADLPASALEPWRAPPARAGDGARRQAAHAAAR